MDETVTLKLILLFFMAIVPFAFGILPIKLLQHFSRHESRRAHIAISFFTCFAGGVVLSVSLIELFPEAREGLAEMAERDPVFGRYPFVEIFVGVGFLLVYFVEEFMVQLLGGEGHGHSHGGPAKTSGSGGHQNLTNSDSLDDVVSNGSDGGQQCRVKYGIMNRAMVSELEESSSGFKKDGNTVKITAPSQPSPLTAINYESMASRKNSGLVNGNIGELSVAVQFSDKSKPQQISPIGSSGASSDEFDASYESSGSAIIGAENGGIRRVQKDSSSDAMIMMTTVVTMSAAERIERRKALIGAITFVLALFIHTSIEGFAFGIQKNLVSVGSLFFGIVVHKVLVFFSVGINLTQALPERPRTVVGLIALLASFSPVGAIIGIFLQGADFDSDAKNSVSTVLICISIGTFFYIALFEIIVPERNKAVPKLLQWFGCALGFTVMAAVLMAAPHGHDHDDGGHDRHHDHGGHDHSHEH